MRILDIIFKDDLLKAGSLVTAVSLVSGGLNFIYNFSMGRMLGTEVYGAFGALFALSIFLSNILLRTLMLSTTSSVSRFRGRGETHLIPGFHSRMIRRMTVCGVATLVILALLSGVIADAFHIDSPSLVILIGIITLFSWLLPIDYGIMQGLQRFYSLAFNQLSRAFLKLLSGVVLVLVGCGIYGAVGGLVVGIAMAFIISLVLIRKNIRPGDHEKDTFTPEKHSVSSDHPVNRNSRASSGPSIGSEDGTDGEMNRLFVYSIHAVLTVVSVAVITNIDVIIVRISSPLESGLYTAASIFGKMIFFLPMGLITVMYPKVVEAHLSGRRTSRLLVRTMLYTAVATGSAALLFLLFPRPFLRIFYGSEFLDAAPLLREYGFLMFLFSLVTVFVYYNLARKQYALIYVFLAWSVLEIIIIVFYHTSMISVIRILTVMVSGFLVMEVFVVIASHDMISGKKRR